MAYKKITLNNVENVSLQVGDIAYYTSVSIANEENPNQISTGGNLVKIGKICEIGNDYIIVSYEDDSFVVGDFIVFSKDKRVNNTSLLGYYAEVKLSNDSFDKAELFALSSEVAPSSK